MIIFAQVIHKAQTVLQNNAKFEAELIHLREELCEARATRAKAESEKKYLVCRLQAALLETHKLGKLAEKAGVDVEGLRGAAAAAGAEERGGGGPEGDRVCRDILRRLADEMALIKRVDWTGSKLEERCRRLERENGALRRTQAELESELVGARLDSKYLDKELAGRIQQIQILLAGGGTSQDLKQKVWAQIESEMHLQRSKTISNMCYSKQKVKEASAKKNAEAEREQQQQEHVSPSTQANSYSPQSDQQQQQQQQQQPGGGNSTGSAGEGTGSTGGGRFKQVHIHKSDAEELGMAILGGSEHGLPIMISEVYPGTAVGRCKKIRAGDVILAVNGDSFDEMGHNDAVTYVFLKINCSDYDMFNYFPPFPFSYLSALRGTIKFDLENRVDDEIDDVCDMDNRYYGLFEKGERFSGPLKYLLVSSTFSICCRRHGERQGGRHSAAEPELPPGPRQEAVRGERQEQHRQPQRPRRRRRRTRLTGGPQPEERQQGGGDGPETERDVSEGGPALNGKLVRGEFW